MTELSDMIGKRRLEKTACFRPRMTEIVGVGVLTFEAVVTNLADFRSKSRVGGHGRPETAVEARCRIGGLPGICKEGGIDE